MSAAPGLLAEQHDEPAHVEHVVATELRPGSWQFDVTVRHHDTGWERYADRWQILAEPSGELLGTRTLLHPHVDEQPFTRSLSGVAIPQAITRVRVRAASNVSDFGGREIVVDLNAQRGAGFEVERRQ